MNTIFSVVLVILLATELVNSQKTVTFSYTNFNTNTSSLTFQGSTKLLSDGVLDLTNPSVTETVGRVLYKTPIPLWDRATGNVASFLTTFSFSMIDLVGTKPYDGLIFFLSPVNNTAIPTNSTGGKLGVVNENDAYNEFVGVEFDNFRNNWDPDYSHFGIDVSSLKSLKYSKWNRVSHLLVRVTVIYDSEAQTLSVVLKDDNGQFATVAQAVDLRDVLTETVWVGFSAAGKGQLHYVHSWSFRSSLSTTISSTSTSDENVSSY